MFVATCGGPAYGYPTILVLRGGSGGSGSVAGSATSGGGGGAGGGALRIVSSVSITVDGAIDASGGPASPGGGGSGGAIHLVATTVGGAGSVRANGGAATYGGSVGRIRFDASTHSFTGTSQPAASLGPLANPPQPTSFPSVRVVSVGGVTVPASPGNSFLVPDVAINSATPVSVVVQARDIPIGSTVTLTLSPEAGAAITATTSPLAGSLANSTASAQVLFPFGVSRVYVTAKW